MKCNSLNKNNRIIKYTVMINILQINQEAFTL